MRLFVRKLVLIVKFAPLIFVALLSSELAKAEKVKLSHEEMNSIRAGMNVTSFGFPSTFQPPTSNGFTGYVLDNPRFTFDFEHSWPSSASVVIQAYDQTQKITFDVVNTTPAGSLYTGSYDGAISTFGLAGGTPMLIGGFFINPPRATDVSITHCNPTNPTQCGLAASGASSKTGVRLAPSLEVRKIWFHNVVEASSGVSSFYSDGASRRHVDSKIWMDPNSVDRLNFLCALTSSTYKEGNSIIHDTAFGLRFYKHDTLIMPNGCSRLHQNLNHPNGFVCQNQSTSDLTYYHRDIINQLDPQNDYLHIFFLNSIAYANGATTAGLYSLANYGFVSDDLGLELTTATIAHEVNHMGQWQSPTGGVHATGSASNCGGNLSSRDVMCPFPGLSVVSSNCDFPDFGWRGFDFNEGISLNY